MLDLSSYQIFLKLWVPRIHSHQGSFPEVNSSMIWSMHTTPPAWSTPANISHVPCKKYFARRKRSPCFYICNQNKIKSRLWSQEYLVLESKGKHAMFVSFPAARARTTKISSSWCRLWLGACSSLLGLPVGWQAGLLAWAYSHVHHVGRHP